VEAELPHSVAAKKRATTPTAKTPLPVATTTRNTLTTRERLQMTRTARTTRATGTTAGGAAALLDVDMGALRRGLLVILIVIVIRLWPMLTTTKMMRRMASGRKQGGGWRPPRRSADGTRAFTPACKAVLKPGPKGVLLLLKGMRGCKIII